MAPRWTIAETKYLTDNYAEIVNDKLANDLNRPLHEIRIKANRMGLTKVIGHYTEVEHKLLTENYSSMSTYELAKLLNRTQNAVGTMARYYGLRKSEKGLEVANHEKGAGNRGIVSAYNPEQLAEFKETFANTQSKVLADKFGKKESTVNRFAYRNGMRKSVEHMVSVKEELRSHIAPYDFEREYKVNHDYFEVIDTPEKAYWLGFMWADGWVVDGWGVGIALQARDVHVLQRFLKVLDSDYPIKPFKVKDRWYCMIYMTSRKMCEDLAKHGVVQRKTYKQEIPNVGFQFIRPFILGLLDGDGCVFVKVNDYAYNFKITNTEATCKWLKQTISEILYVGGSCSKTITHAWTWSLGGRKQFIKMAKWLYEDDLFCLERKKQKALLALK